MHHGHTLIRRVVTALLLALTLGAGAASAGSITVQWDPNTEHDLQGYRVYIGTQPGVHTQSVDVGNTTSFVYNSALDGQQYCFAVVAYTAEPALSNKSVEVCTDTTSNQPPTLTNPGARSNPVGVALTLQLQGSDPESSPVTYTATDLPTGLTVNPNTGFIAGTPTTPKTFSVKATISDGNSSTTQAFTWTITAGVPGVTTLLRPTGTIATTTPTFEWQSVVGATVYRLWVDDASTTDPKIRIDYTPAQAGCATAGAVCQVAPGIALAPGRASFSVRASNLSGLGPWSGAMDFTVPDGKVPTVAIAAPTANDTFSTANQTVTLGGTSSDDLGVTSITWTNNRGGSGAAIGTASWSAGPIPLFAGSNILTVIARDAAGNVATDVLTVTRSDAFPPTVQIAAPTTNATHTTDEASVNFAGSATDDIGVTQVTWATDKGASGVASGTTAWTISDIPLAAGVTVVTVTAKDAAGREGSDLLTVTRTDGIAPRVEITTPSPLATFSTTSATVALGGTAADNVGATQVTWSNSQGGGGIAAGTTSWSAAGVVLKPGANVITVTARDAAGNLSSDSITVTLTDASAPIVAITVPTASATDSTPNASIALGGTASDAFGVQQVRWASDQGGSGVADGTTAWSVSNVTLRVGVNVITITATDAAGNHGTNVITVTRIDDVDPEVAITAPVSGTTFTTTNATFALSGTAFDNIGVTQVIWSNSKGGHGVAAGTTAWTIGGVSLQPGANVITVTVKDAAGNAATAMLAVTLTDAVAPTIAIAAPTAANEHTTTASSLALGGTASDFFGVTEVRWTNSRGGGGTAVGTSEWSVPAVALMPGANVITVTARDAAGNTATDSIAITSDGKAPDVAITAPSAVGTFATNTETVTLAGTASDDVGVTELRWANSRGGSGQIALAPSWSAALPLEAGLNIISVTAQDVAGNRSTATISVTRDSHPPSIAIAAPAAAGTFVSTLASAALRGTATDDVNVTQVTWQNSRGGSGIAAGTSEWTVPSVALQPGANVITVTARDGAGNVTSANLTIALDNKAPVVSIASPTAFMSMATTDTTIALGGTASDDTEVTEVSWSNNQGGGGVATGTAAWSAHVALRPGVNKLTVTARDKAGNVAISTLSVRATDVQAPSLRIAAPSSDEEWSSAAGVISLEGTATDDFGPVRITWVNDRGGNGKIPVDGRWVVRVILKEGVNVITVTANDGFGHSTTDTVRVMFDCGAPTIALTSPTTAANYNSPAASVALTGMAGDDKSVVRVTWSTDKGQVGVATGTTSWSIPAVPVQLGAATVVTVTALDDSGNTTSLTLKVTNADATAPVVKVYAPTTAPTFVTGESAVTIGGTATDAVGATQVSWTNAQGGSGVAFGTSSWSVPGILLAPGVNEITVTARDAAGNTGVAVLTVTSTQPSSTQLSSSSSVR